MAKANQKSNWIETDFKTGKTIRTGLTIMGKVVRVVNKE
jgi:hypothetical protein